MTEQAQVRQHNAITTARYEYSEIQLDIFFYLLSQLRLENTSGEYTIIVNKLSEITGKQYNYTYLREATESMGSRMFEIDDERSYKQLWLFQSVEYIKGEGRIEIKLSEKIRPYLFDLKENFTSFQLYSALRLSSKFAKRIYTIASQWKSKGETPRYRILDFKHMLGLYDPKTGVAQYEKISTLKDYVLGPAIKQINEHTDLQIDYSLEKEGRSFEFLQFKVKKQALSVALPSPAATGIDPGVLDNCRLFLESVGVKDPAIVSQIVSSTDLVSQTMKFAYQLRTGAIKADKNPGGFLLTVLGLKKAKSRKQ
jgi:plasmid replication initiation protein